MRNLIGKGYCQRMIKGANLKNQYFFNLKKEVFKKDLKHSF